MKLSWALQAEDDLNDIVSYYDVIGPGLADEMLDRIFEGPRMLIDYPYLGQPAGAFELRKWAVRRTPFILLYRVSDAEIEIARVIHSASDWEQE